MFIGGPCKEAASGRKGCCGVSAGLVCGFSCFLSVVGVVCSACMYIPVDVHVALLKAIVAKSSFVCVLDMFIGGPCEEEACGRRGSCGVNAGLVCVFSCFCFVVCFV